MRLHFGITQKALNIKAGKQNYMKDVIASLHRLERAVLPVLQKHSAAEDIVKQTRMQEVEVLRDNFV